MSLLGFLATLALEVDRGEEAASYGVRPFSCFRMVSMFEFIDPSDPYERCGVFMGHFFEDGDIEVLEVIELPNRSDRPLEAYRIGKRDLDRAYATRRYPKSGVVGVWHTHPPPFDKWPSEADWDATETVPSHWWSAIYKPTTGEIVWYDITGITIEENDNA